ncbi:hypothetical protein ERJ75_000868600 [Trypanosoma vivax]|nr:hypothetical protein ERJ75_000868600 [Trypanosoma vivax]
MDTLSNNEKSVEGERSPARTVAMKRQPSVRIAPGADSSPSGAQASVVAPSEHEVRVLNGASMQEAMHHPPAWECFVVGHFDESCALGSRNNDLMCWVASMAMRGETGRALRTMEAFVVAACILSYERRTKGDKEEAFLLFRLSEIMLNYISGEKLEAKVVGKSLLAMDQQCRSTVLDACQIVNWDAIHRWFIIALILHDEDYTVPNILWLRYFFALFPNGDPPWNSEQKMRAVRRESVTKLSFQPMDGHEMLEMLISHCEENERLLISAITAWKLRRFRSAISSATEILNMEDGENKITDEYMRVFLIFIRCMCLVEIGERTLAARDAVSLMKHDKSFIAVVGAGIASFLLPLPQGIDLVRQFDGSPNQRRHAFALCEYVHALTLIQLGSMESGMEVIMKALKYAPLHDVKEWLTDLLVVACIALEDSTTLADLSLTPHQQLYIALCPAFFGGFRKHNLRLRLNTPAGRLISPKCVPRYASVRQMLPYHMSRSHQHFSKEKYLEAWEEVSVAVGCVEEIVGSLEFALSDCSPLFVYTFGCRIGERVLGTLMELMTSTGDLSKRFDENLLSLRGPKGNALGETVVRQCLKWANRLREFHPNVRLGRLVVSKCHCFCHEDDFVSRAINIAQRYPLCVLAQNCLTIALYSNHHVREAADCAEKMMQTFPHSAEVKALYKYMLRKDGVYYFNYRGLIPVHFAPGSQQMWTFRGVFALMLIVVNLFLFLATLALNMPSTAHGPESMKEIAICLQLPSVAPLFYFIVIFVYAVMTCLSRQNLTRTVLQDLFFCDGRFNRFMFALRGMAFLNAFNALQITLAGNNFLLQSHWYTLALYLFLLLVFVPFTSRTWFLPSFDEPMEGIWTWLTLFAIDMAAAIIMLVPHIILFMLEPFMFILYFFFRPPQPPTDDTLSGNVGKRLFLHKVTAKTAPSRYSMGSGSNFIHVRMMRLLYHQTHSNLSTMRLIQSQMDQDNYRVFPMIEVYEDVPLSPLDMDKNNIPFPEQVRNVRRKSAISFFGGGGGKSNAGGADRYEDGDDDDDFIPPGRSASVMSRRMLDLGDSVTETDSQWLTAEDAMNIFMRTTVSLNREFRRQKKLKETNVVDLVIARSSPVNMFKKRESISLKRRGSTKSVSHFSLETTPSRGERGSIFFRRGSRRGSTFTRDDKSELGDSETSGGKEEATFCFCDGSPFNVQDAANSSHIHETPGDIFSPTQSVLTSSSISDCKAATSKPSDIEITGTGIVANPLLCPLSNGPLFSPSGSNVARDAEVGTLFVQGRSSADVNCVLSDEQPLHDALQKLCEALVMSPGFVEDSDSTSFILTKLNAVQRCVQELASESGAQRLCIRSQRPQKLLCEVLLHFVKISTANQDPALQDCLAALREILQLVNLDSLIDFLLHREIPRLCLTVGLTDLLTAMLIPSCAQRMSASEWSSLLGALESESSKCRASSLCIVMEAMQHARAECIAQISTQFHQAVKETLLRGSSELAPTDLYVLLGKINEQKHVEADFWDKEGADSQTIFSGACAAGNLHLVEALWDLNLVRDPNRVQSDQTTALMQAVMCGSTYVVQWFCNHAPGPTLMSFKYVHPLQGSILDIAPKSDSGMYDLLKRKIIKLDDSKDTPKRFANTI